MYLTCLLLCMIERTLFLPAQATATTTTATSNERTIGAAGNRKNVPKKQKEETTKPDIPCVSVGTKLTPISELKTLFTAGQSIFYFVGNDRYVLDSADEPIF